MPDAGKELTGRSPPGRGPLLPSGASRGAPYPHPCPERALLSGAGQRGRQDSGVNRSLLQLLS